MSTNMMIALVSLGLAALSGALLLNTGLSFRRMIPAVPGWPRARAVVLRSRATTAAGRPWPDIQFRYVVEGQKHVSASVQLGRWTGTADACRRLVEAHPVGAEVQIYYNPAQPFVGVLMPGGDASHLLRGAWQAPLTFGLPGVFFLVKAMHWLPL